MLRCCYCIADSCTYYHSEGTKFTHVQPAQLTLKVLVNTIEAMEHF